MPGAHSFGRYRVTGTLGSGAMGEVYSAVDEVLGRDVAVKTLHGGASGLAARLLDERFRQEARAIASLAHAGVVQVFDIDLAADPPYLVMERVSGPSLKERLAERPLSERELRALGIQIANALAAAHAAGVVHRDVKPANILAAGAGTWKLADFGVAHVPDSSLTMTGQFVGSPAYAPPEALLRGQLGPEGDIYGLGATLYQAAAGRWPRAEATTGALFAPVQPLRELAPGISPQVAEAIDRAVAVEPAQRPSAGELASALARANTAPVMDAAHVVTPLPFAAPVDPGGATEFVASMPGGPVATVAVASTPGAPIATVAVASTPGAPLSTAYGATSPAGFSAVGLPPPPPRSSVVWQKWALLGAILVVIIVLAVTRQSPSPPRGAVSAQPTLGVPQSQPQSQPPSTIRAAQPPLETRGAAKDWRKIVKKLQEGDYAEAREHLADFEDMYGESGETRDLATQLDALPQELLEMRHRKYKD